MDWVRSIEARCPGVKLMLEYAPPTNSSAPFYDVPVRCIAKGPNFNDTLRILSGETSVELKVYSDATFVEAFWGKQRTRLTHARLSTNRSMQSTMPQFGTLMSG